MTRGPFLRMEVGHVPQRGGGAERFSVRERKRSSENSTEAKNNPQRRINYGWGSNLKIAEKGFQELEPRHTSGRKPTRQLPERVMRREGRAKLQKFQPVQESPGGGDTKGQQTKLLTSLDGRGGQRGPTAICPRLGEDSHARRWWPTRRRADAGNFHPKFALERQTGAAWNRLETGRARPLKVCRREFLSGRKAEKKICYFLAGRRKRIFFFSGPRAEKKLSFGPEGRKENVLLSGRA